MLASKVKASSSSILSLKALFTGDKFATEYKSISLEVFGDCASDRTDEEREHDCDFHSLEQEPSLLLLCTDEDEATREVRVAIPGEDGPKQRRLP